MSATVAAVVAFTGASSETCYHTKIHADWADLQALNTSYGRQVVSAGLTYSDITQMSEAGR